MRTAANRIAAQGLAEVERWSRVPVLLVAILAMELLTAANAEPVRSTLEGVYTYDQAERGEALYAEYCASCHGPRLTGDKTTPGLVGVIFWSRWGNLPLSDLFSRVSLTMPLDERIGTLNDDVVVDVISYLLRANNVPWGTEEMSPDPALLSTVAIHGQ